MTTLRPPATVNGWQIAECATDGLDASCDVVARYELVRRDAEGLVVKVRYVMQRARTGELICPCGLPYCDEVRTVLTYLGAANPEPGSAA